MLKLNKKLNRLAAVGSASVLTGISAGKEAFAAATSFNAISQRLTTQISDLPGLFTAVAYIFGVLLAILGLLKIKEHVEQPTQTPLKDGAIKLCIGGALLVVPTFMTAMQDMLAVGGDVDKTQTQLQKISTFNAVK